MIKYDIERVICNLDKEHPDMLMEITVENIKKSEEIILNEEENEIAVLLLKGKWLVSWDKNQKQGERTSLFDENPECIHFSIRNSVKIRALEDSQILLQKTKNNNEFGVIYYKSENVKNEVFGDGVAGGTCRRIVRTIFDYNNASYSNMVMGEVITYPGRWSSYPPHYHQQPEVYYYRFDKEQGFGTSIIGENAFIIKNNSAAIINGGLVHPQAAAPGYAMYYCWMIRHLENNPWTERVMDENHKWMDYKNAEIWEGR